jgi:hypothetical protein
MCGHLANKDSPFGGCVAGAPCICCYRCRRERATLRRSKGLAGASASLKRYGEVADGARTGLGEGIPKVPKLRSRSLKAFGAIEVAHHQFLPGEIQTLPFKGPVINLHLSALTAWYSGSTT